MQKMNKVLCLILILFSLISCVNHNSKPICDTKPDNYYYGYKDNNGYTIYHSTIQAKQCSEQTGRPILIMFSTWRYLASRNQNWEIFKDNKVKQIIDNNYLFLMLFVDDTTRLSSIDSTNRTDSGKIIETIGEFNINLQIKKFQTTAQPIYAIVDSKMNIIVEPIGYVPVSNKNQFVEFLMKGINK